MKEVAFFLALTGVFGCLWIMFLKLIGNLLTKSKPTNRDIVAVESADNPTLFKWWSILNSWEWPDELGPSEPPKYIRGGRRVILMKLIENKVGIKYLLRNHNAKMTEEEFTDFWENRSIHNPNNR